MQMLQYKLQNNKSLLLKLQPNNLETKLSGVQNKNRYLQVKDINTIFVRTQEYPFTLLLYNKRQLYAAL